MNRTTTTAVRLEFRELYETPLLLASAAAVVVAVHALASAPAGARGAVLFAGVAGVLATTTRYWLDKRSSRVALGILVAVAAIAVPCRVPVAAYEGVARYQSTLELLVGVGLLRKVAARTRLDATLAACTACVSSGVRASLLALLSALLAAPLSVGAVAIVCTSLGSVVKPQLATAVVSMRALGATMFVLPTTAGAAIVAASLPGLDRSAVMKLGAAPFLLVMLSLCVGRPLEVIARDAVPAGRAVALWPLALFWVLVALLLAFSPLHGATAVALAACGAFIAEAARERRPGAFVVEDVRDALRGVSAELVLLVACGVMTGFLSRAPLPPGVSAALRGVLASRAAATGVLLFFMPLLSVAGAHPVVLFSLAFPLLDRSVLGGGAREYVAWITMFALAQLVSPTSTSARLASSSLGVSPRRVSFGSHALFALALAAGVWTYVVFS